ncbi:MFS transporter [Nonomuraea ferruginea]
MRETLPADQRESGGFRHTLRSFRRLLGDRPFMGCALSAGLAFGAMFAYISGSPFVLQDVYGASPQQYSLIFGLNAFGLIAMSQVGGRLAGRVPQVRLILAGLGVALAGGALLLLAVVIGLGLTGVVAGLFVIMCGQGLILPGTGALAPGLASRRRWPERPPRCSACCSSRWARSRLRSSGCSARTRRCPWPSS